MNVKLKITLIVAVFLAAMMTAGCCCYTGSGAPDDNPGSGGAATTPKPVYTPTPRPTPTPAAAGFSKANPVSTGTGVMFKDPTIPGSSLRITCLESYHGYQAYNMIEANDGYTFVKPGEPDEGNEYLIVKFRVEFIDHQSGNPEEFYASYSDFKCYTPDNMRVYDGDDEWFNYMNPRLIEKLFKGDSFEGWVTFEVKQGYSNYLISYKNDKMWFSV